MQNDFEPIENISKEEFQVLIDYLQHPHLFANTRGKRREKYRQVNFWHHHYQGLKITKPDTSTGQRYFKLPDRHGTKIAIHHKHSKDNHEKFVHGARVFEIEGRFKLFVNLKKINASTTQFKCLINQNGMQILIKKVPMDKEYLPKELHHISPEVYVSENFQSRKHDYQIMKIFKENLLGFHAKNPELREQITEALITEVKRIHALGVIHGDIKPENFCVEKTESGLFVWLIDFDHCFLTDEKKPKEGFYGTLPYFAPEFFSRLPIFIRSPYQFFNFKAYLQLSLYQNLIACLESRYQKQNLKHGYRQSLSGLLDDKIYGFLSLGEITQYRRVQLSLRFIEDYLLKLNWREHITQASDVFALGCILKYHLETPQTSRFFPIMENMLTEEPKHRYQMTA